MSSLPKEHECPHILIVEGYSDLLFYAEFLEHLGRTAGVFIKDFKGKKNILKLQTLGDYLTPKLLAEKQSVGILLDADDNPAGTVRSVKNLLKDLTGREIEEGTWHEEAGKPRLGFFVAPDPVTMGEIETLIWNALPADEKHSGIKQAVGGYLSDMEKLALKPKSVAKGQVGAYLAVINDEDPRIGPAARENRINFDTPGFTRLHQFLETLPKPE